MSEEMVSDDFLSKKDISKIEKTIEELKTKHSLRKIKAIIVKGGKDEGFDKEFFVGYFRMPNLELMDKFAAMAKAKSDIMAQHILGRDCMVEGDAELFDDEDLYLQGVAGELGILFQQKQVQVLGF